MFDTNAYHLNWYHKHKAEINARRRAIRRTDEFRARDREYYKSHAARINELAKAARLKKRLLVIEAYGGKCICCGESNHKFLTVDHKESGGRKHRRELQSGYGFYIWIIQQKFPDNLQLMCYNCNCARYKNGGVCPHQETNTVSPKGGFHVLSPLITSHSTGHAGLLLALTEPYASVA